MGAWFEAQVTKVTVKKTTDPDSPTSSTDSEPQTTLYYHVTFDE